MKLRALSATGIKDFLQCQLKIVFRYDREIKSTKNDHMKIGIAVHNALEQFVRRMIHLTLSGLSVLSNISVAILNPSPMDVLPPSSKLLIASGNIVSKSL